MPIILFLTHQLGGGIQKHINELRSLLSDRALILTLRPGLIPHYYQLEVPYDTNIKILYFRCHESIDDLVNALRYLGVSKLHYHHLMGFAPSIWFLHKTLGVSYDVTIHDYFFVCPQINLTDEAGRYCGEQGTQQCELCLARRRHTAGLEIVSWRNRSAALLEGAERVFVPSMDTANRMSRYIPRANLVLAPHPDIQFAWRSRVVEPQRILHNEPLRVVCIGVTAISKGLRVLEECAVQANSSNFPLQFHLLGEPDYKISRKALACLKVHGFYKDEALEQMIIEIRPHIAWFPATCPETYSYALSGALSLGIPIICSDLGSFPDRLAKCTNAWIIPWSISPTEMNNIFLKIRNSCTSDVSYLKKINNCQFIFNKKFCYSIDYLMKTERPSLISDAFSHNLTSLENKFSKPGISYKLHEKKTILLKSAARLLRSICR